MFVNSTPISFRSVTQKFVTLSVTEAEIAAGVMVAQDMLYMYCLLESLKLKVELPMMLEMDNSGTVHIGNSWSMRGRTHHVDVHNYFLCKLKDQGLLVIRHIAGELNDADIFPKNVMSAVLNRHIPLYVADDQYLSMHGQDSSGEAGTGVESRVLGPARLRQDLNRDTETKTVQTTSLEVVIIIKSNSA